MNPLHLINTMINIVLSIKMSVIRSGLLIDKVDVFTCAYKRGTCYGNVSGWLSGWLAGWLSHSGIVSKRLNLSENFFDHLKAPSL